MIGRTINKFSIEDAKILQRLNPFWEKKLHKWIKYLKNVSNKFKDGFDYFNKEFYEIKDYPILFDQINNYRNFLNKKKQIFTTSLRILNKFQKILINYNYLVGFCLSMQNIVNIIKLIDVPETQSKKEIAVEETNKLIKKETDKLISVIKKEINNDELLKVTSENIDYNNKEITNTLTSLAMLFEFVNKLYSKKQITEVKILNVQIEGVSYNAAYNSIVVICDRFIKNIY